MKFFIIPLFFMLSLIACKEPILHDLTELNANKILTKLHAESIDSKKLKQGDGSWQILVEKKQIIQALKLIEQQRFFRKYNQEKLSNGLISSQEKNKLEYERYLSKQLEATLHSLPGVLEAHIHLNLEAGQKNWRKHNDKKINSESGSVLLIVSKEYNLSSREIKEIVSGASGLEVSNISVVESFPNILAIKSKTVTPEVPSEVDSRFFSTSFLSYLIIFIFVIPLLSYIKNYQQKQKIKILKNQLATLPKI